MRPGGPLTAPRIKICCICDADELTVALAGGADLVGFVAPPLGGMGVIDEDQIAQLIAHVPPGVTAVLLSGHSDEVRIGAQILRCRPGAVQLVVPTSAETRAALRRRFPGVQLLQVVHVHSAAAIVEAIEAQEGSDAVLLDSSDPVGGALGATGRTHDWAVSAEIVRACHRPVFLAGGLRATNVGRALSEVAPHGIDLCTGVRAGGRLDAGLVARFVTAARSPR